MISSAVRPRVAPTSTAAFVSPPARSTGVRATASGAFETSRVRVFEPFSSKSRRVPLARFSTAAFENGPPSSSIDTGPPGESGSSSTGMKVFASKRRSAWTAEPSLRVTGVAVGSREASAVR